MYYDMMDVLANKELKRESAVGSNFRLKRSVDPSGLIFM